MGSPTFYFYPAGWSKLETITLPRVSRLEPVQQPQLSTLTTANLGMVQVSPDTRLTGWDGCSGYHYADSVVYGFSHTHLSGTGASDYGDILFICRKEST